MINFFLFQNNIEISMIYNINNNQKIKLFDKIFVDNNKENCILSINNKSIDICEYYSLNKEIKDKYIKFKLIQKNRITNMSNMFFNCELLSSLPDLSKWNTTHVKDMSNIFSNCKLLSSLSDISKWNTSNDINMSNMFSNCSSLISLPDLSKWKTNNVIDMNSMF